MTKTGILCGIFCFSLLSLPVVVSLKDSNKFSLKRGKLCNPPCKRPLRCVNGVCVADAVAEVSFLNKFDKDQ